MVAKMALLGGKGTIPAHATEGSVGGSKQTMLNVNPDLTPRESAIAEGLRLWAEIDLDKLTANIEALKQHAGEARLFVVVKANAYGHGAISVALAAIQAGAWGIGVAGMEEGDEL